MKKKNTKQILNKEYSLTKRSKSDKISTLSTKELGVEAPQFSCFKIYLFGEITLVAHSNRANKTSLTIADAHLPRFVDLPKVGNKKMLRIIAIERLF